MGGLVALNGWNSDEQVAKVCRKSGFYVTNVLPHSTFALPSCLARSLALTVCFANTTGHTDELCHNIGLHLGMVTAPW